MTTTDHATNTDRMRELARHPDVTDAIAQMADVIASDWVSESGQPTYDLQELVDVLANEAITRVLRALVADGRVTYVPGAHHHDDDRYPWLSLLVPTDVACSAEEFHKRVELAVTATGAAVEDGVVELVTGLCAFEGAPDAASWELYAAALRAEGLEPPRRRHARVGCSHHSDVELTQP